MDTVKPLAGLRVVDFTWIAAGPLGTRILANFGAQVIKVESRAHMDSLRYDLRPRGSTSENTSAIFAQVNPGKLSVSLDLSRDEGRDLVRRLIATADLVTNNFRPGALERIGLGYEALREIKPDIVLLNMPGCGREGPWSQVATMGNLVMAASGWNSLKAPYVMSSRQVDKGVARSGRSWFSTMQFEVHDSAGILYATARTTRRTLLVKRGE